MSHYQPGRQSHLQQNNNAANGSTQPAMHPGSYTPYTSQSDQVPALRRTPSYIAGDDSLYSPIASNDSTSGGQAFLPVAGTYNNFANSPQTNLGSRHSQFSVSSSQRSNPSRTSSHGSSATSTYQTQPYSSSMQMPGVQGNVTYNPQQYARPHSLSQSASMSYNPQAYTSVNTPAGGTAYQTYNPAAYQGNTATTYSATNILRQPSTRFYTQQGPTYSMPSPPMQAPPPPPPPRSSDHPYGPRSPQLSDSSSPGLAYGGFSYASQTSPPLNRPPSNQQLTQTASTSYGSNSPYSIPSPHSPPSQPAYAPYATPSYFSQGPASASEPLLEEQPPAPPAHNRTSISGLSLRASQSSPTYRSSLPPSSPRRTDTLTRHPQSRPLPGPPELDTEANESYGGPGNSYDDLMRQVDAAVQMSSQGMGHDTLQRRPSSNMAQISLTEYRPTLHDGTPAHQTHSDENFIHTNGSVATGTGQYVNYDAYSDESDAEAAAGIAMMHMADEEERAEAERQRGRSGTISSLFPTYSSQATTQDASNLHPEGSSDSDYAQYDLALYGGGYEGQMHYGDIPNTEADFRATAAISGESFAAEDEHMPPFRFTTPARVDTGGTGGLSEPNALGRRLSFDYGDEDVDPVTGLPEGYSPSGSQSPEKGEPADLFYHPGLRPLPPAPVERANADVLAHLIPAGTYHHNLPYDETGHYDDQYRPLPQPTSSNSSTLSHSNQPQVPRSTSLSSHSSTPRTDAPIRSKTDADRAKYKQQQEFLRQQASAIKQTETLGFNATPEPSAIALDLPTIPAGRRKKFNPAKLSSEQFRKCTKPWALSEILAWVKELSEDENDLKEQAVVDAIVALFTHKVPTMNTADAETLGLSVVKNMLNEGALIADEEWVKFSDKPMSGVLFQITGSGCYSARLHTHDTETFGRCYSYHCMRTLKKINLRAQAMEPQRKAQDWVTFYNVPKEVWESHSRKEIDRQNNLHEIVTTEDAFIEQLDVLRVLYRDQLATMQPSIISPKRQEKFLRDVFGKVDAVKKVNEDYLLAQLKYRQKEQGPFIAGFSDIFREWIRKAKAVYIDYAATFPNANYMVRKEAERNALFRHFLNQARDNKLSNRLSWDTYLKAPITRIQRYTLLLSTVYKNMAKDSEEKTNLALAIEEIKVVALECDNKVGEMTKKVDLAELSSKLQLRPGMSKEVELNLEHLGREIMFQGDLQRPGTRTRFNLVDTHAILFDHYLVLAKIVQVRDLAKTAKSEVYDVSKLPIPMDLLVLESTNDDPVIKSSVRGVSTVTAPTAAAAAARGGGGGGGGGGGPPGTQGHPGMPHHTASFVATTTLENSKDDKILYPFKVKHLGKTPTYTLFAPSIQNRQDWCQKITEAKTRHAASLFAQNAEPFRLRVLADAAFAYAESPGPKTTVIKGTPLDRAIRELEARYANLKIRPNPVCRALVNCATVFQQPSGQLISAIGTDFGVFMSIYDDPRGWQRMIAISRVTQISVFEDFNLLLLIADKSLIAYHLDVVCPPSGAPSQTSQHDSARRAPRKLSGNREVGYFAVGRMKDRLLVVYKKRDGISSTFKVMEPVLDKSTTTRSRFMPSRRGQTEFFRDYDEFYIPAESYNINLFHSSLAISTQRGIEVLTLDKKQPWSIPMLNTAAPEAQPYLTGIGNRIKDLRPLGMFRLSDAEFLLAYSECAVYVNKLGDISRGVVMEFVGRAHTACLHGKFLILLNDDFVEVRNAMNGRLRQVIPGRNVVCLDDGGNQGAAADSGNNNNGFQESNFAGGHGTNGHGSNDSARYGRTVKICMQHPEYERTQIVLELITNEGQNE